MARNIYNSNHMISKQWANGSGSAVSSGDIVVMGGTEDATLGIALVDIPDGESGSVGINCGVVATKLSAAVFKDGESLTWDLSELSFDDNQVATPASGDVSGSCRADEDGIATTLTVKVWLTGIPGTLTT